MGLIFYAAKLVNMVKDMVVTVRTRTRYFQTDTMVILVNTEAKKTLSTRDVHCL